MVIFLNLNMMRLTCTLLSVSGSVGNSTQINSYSDSGYQDAVSYYSSGQAQGECQQRLQNSLPGSGGISTLQRSSRAEGQAVGHHQTPELQVDLTFLTS